MYFVFVIYGERENFYKIRKMSLEGEPLHYPQANPCGISLEISFKLQLHRGMSENIYSLSLVKAPFFRSLDFCTTFHTYRKNSNKFD